MPGSGVTSPPPSPPSPPSTRLLRIEALRRTLRAAEHAVAQGDRMLDAVQPWLERVAR